MSEYDACAAEWDEIQAESEADQVMEDAGYVCLVDLEPDLDDAPAPGPFDLDDFEYRQRQANGPVFHFV